MISGTTSQYCKRETCLVFRQRVLVRRAFQGNRVALSCHWSRPRRSGRRLTNSGIRLHGSEYPKITLPWHYGLLFWSQRLRIGHDSTQLACQEFALRRDMSPRITQVTYDHTRSVGWAVVFLTWKTAFHMRRVLLKCDARCDYDTRSHS